MKFSWRPAIERKVTCEHQRFWKRSLRWRWEEEWSLSLYFISLKTRLRWKCLHGGLCTFPFSGSQAWDTARVQERSAGWMNQCPLNLHTVLDPFSTYQSCHLIWNLTLQCGFTHCLASRLCPHGFHFSNLILHQGFLAPLRPSFSHSYLYSSLQSQGLCTCCFLSGTHMAWLTWAHSSDPSSLPYRSPLDFLDYIRVPFIACHREFPLPCPGHCDLVIIW